MNYLELREKYPEFVYRNFSYELKDGDLEIKFLFEVGEFKFSPRIIFKQIPLERFNSLEKQPIENLIFHLGLAEIPSYWKAFTSPYIKIQAGSLNGEQINWWKDLIIQGMGQFFYENKIDFTLDDFVTISTTSDKRFNAGPNIESYDILIPVGGGKDSAVTLELLKGVGRTAALLINPTQAATDVVEASGIGQKIIVERSIDKVLLDLNEQGYLNGHTPFSSVVAFIALFAAYVYGYKEIALSNERSSDEENTMYMGRKINHQYSKTFEFENKFRSYVKNYLVDINYFSFLRPLYELQIAKIFSRMRKYFSLFRSCNVGQKTNSWCRSCPKCLSTYILLKPFLTKQDLIGIFGEDLLIKPSLKETLSELTDENKVKPFECVGTRAELQDALEDDMFLIDSWNEANNLSSEYAGLLKQEIQK